jgi:hypothetical protein
MLDLSTHTNKQIERLAVINAQKSSRLNSHMIAMGRGNERPSEYSTKSDDLSIALQKNNAECYAIRTERAARGCTVGHLPATNYRRSKA